MVEGAAAGAADLIEDPVEYLAAAFVFIEAFVDEVAEEAAGLRHAPADGIRDARRRIALRCGRVLEEADDVARAGQANTDDARIAGAINDVVDQSGFETAIGSDGARS